MSTKSCIYKNASKLGEVDGGKLLKSYDSYLDANLTPKLAFVQSMADMVQSTLHSRDTLKAELKKDFSITIPVRTASYLDTDTTLGSMAKDLLANAIGMVTSNRYIKRSLSDYVQEKSNSRNTSVLTNTFNFFSRYKAGFRAPTLPVLNDIQAAALERMGTFIAKFHETNTELNNFIEGDLYVTNLEGGTVTIKGKKEYILGDLTGYFVQEDSDGKRYLNENLSAAMGMVGLNYLGTHGKMSLHNDDTAIRSILGLPADSSVPTAARAELADKGDIRVALAERFGDEIFSLLGLAEVDTAHGDSIAKIKLNLGLTTIATMMHMGILEQVAVEYETLAQWANNHKDLELIEGTLTNFIRIASQPAEGKQGLLEPHKSAQSLLDLVKHSDKVLDTLLSLGSNVREVSFDIIESAPTKVKNSTQSVAKSQQAAIKKHQDIPQGIIEPNLEVYNFLGLEAWQGIGGYEQNVDNLHITQRLSALGVNRDIDREHESISEFIDGMPSLTSIFYYPVDVWKNIRMGYASSSWNTQTNKVQRWLSGAKSWTSEIPEGKSEKLTLFKLAIAASFGSKFDRQSIDMTMSDFDAILNDPINSKALKAIDDLQKGTKLSEAQSQSNREYIIEAIEQGGEKAHTMAGLVALNDYDNNVHNGVVENAFSTSLGLETDGITNGVIITLLQSMLDDNIDTLLASGGMYTDNKTVFFGDWYDGVTNIDSYQRLSIEWNKHLNKLDIPVEMNQTLSALFKDMVEELDDGKIKVTQFGRNLSKAPLMTSNYMASIDTIRANLKDEAYETWVEQMMSTESQGDLEQFLKATEKSNDAYINSKIKSVRADTGMDGEKKRKFLYYLNTQLSSNKGKLRAPVYDKRNDWAVPQAASEAIKGAVDSTYGLSLEVALSTQLPGVTRYSTSINQGFEIMFAAFKAVYDSQIKDAELDKFQDSTNDVNAIGSIRLSESERRAIYEGLQYMLPAINTPMSTKVTDRLVVIKSSKIREFSNDKNSTQVKFAIKLKNRANKSGELTSSMSGVISETVLETPLVAPVAVSTQMMDASIIVHQMDLYDFLNVHDAQILGLDFAEAGTESYSREFNDINKRYSVLEETLKATKEALKSLKSYDSGMYDAFITNTEISDSLDNITVEEAIKSMEVTHKLSTKERKDFFENRVTVSGQAALPTAGAVIQEYTENTNELFDSSLKESIDKVHDDFGDPLGSTGAAFSWEDFKAQYQEQLTGKNALTIFEQVKSLYPSDVTDSPEQVAHLKSTLDGLVNKVISELDAKPISIDINNIGEEVRGQTKGTVVQIQVGRTGSVKNTSQLSVQETFVHEIVHQITRYALDTNFPLRTQIEKLRSLVKKQITVEDFMPATVAVSIAVDYKAAKKRYDYIFEGADSIHEFVAFGLTNESIRKKLSTLSATPSRTLTSGSFMARLSELWNAILDFMQGKIYETSNLSADKALDSLVAQLVDTNHRYHNSISKSLNFMDKTNDKLISGLNKVVWEPMEAYGVKLHNQKNLNVVERTLKTLTGIPFIIKDTVANKSVLHSLKQVLRALNLTESSTLVKLAREVQGATDNTIQWHNLLRKSKMWVDQERRHVAERISKVVFNSFGKDLTDTDADSINQGWLKTDLSSITDQYSAAELVQLLNDAAYSKKEEVRVTNALKAYGDNGNHYIDQANGLGDYMTDGIITKHGQKFNAYSIVQLHGIPRKVTGDLKAAEKLVDTLATLVAIKNLDMDIRTRAATILEREFKRGIDDNGAAVTLNTHANFKKESLRDLFHGNKTQMVKGYTTEIYSPYVETKIGTVAQEQEMKEMGYSLEYKLPIDDKDPNRTRRALYVTKHAALNTYLKSTFSLTNKKAKGQDIMDTMRITSGSVSNTDKIIAMHSIGIKEAKLVAAQFNSSTVTQKKSGAVIMAPVTDDQGNTTSYRYVMSEEAKVNILEKSNKFDVILGKMQASIHDKTRSEQINYEILETAHKDYIANSGSGTGKFITIGKNATESRYKEIYDLMPKQAKLDMQHLWGSDNIQIREELVDLIFGYRKLSFTDIKIPLLRDEAGNSVKLFDKLDKVIPRASHSIKIFERIIQEVVGIAKNNIVIKSGVVLLDNVISNNVILTMKGVSPLDNVRDSAIAFKALAAYQAEFNTRANLQSKLDRTPNISAAAARSLTVKIATLSASIKRNPVRELVEEGIFQSIIEDIAVHNEDYSIRGQIASALEGRTKAFTQGKEKTEKAVAGLTEVYKQVYMSNDTAVYQQLLQLTQKSDFVARFVLYQHRMRKLDKANLKEKLTEAEWVAGKKEALLEVIETFINYDIPTSPAMQYLNDMGILMFTKFLFRIQKVIFRMLKEQPAHSVALFALEHGIGDIASIDDTFGFTSVYNRVGFGAGLLGGAATDVPLLELVTF